MISKQKLGGIEFPYTPQETGNYQYQAVFLFEENVDFFPGLNLNGLGYKTYIMICSTSPCFYYNNAFCYNKDSSFLLGATFSTYYEWPIWSNYIEDIPEDYYHKVNSTTCIWSNHEIKIRDSSNSLLTKIRGTSPIIIEGAEPPYLWGSRSVKSTQGKFVTLKAPAYNIEGSISYQWQKVGENSIISTETEPNYTFSAVDKGEFKYYGIATNTVGLSKTSTVCSFDVSITEPSYTTPQNAEFVLGIQAGSFLKRIFNIELPKPVINLNFSSYKKNEQIITNLGTGKDRYDGFIPKANLKDVVYNYALGQGDIDGLQLNNGAPLSVDVENLIDGNNPFTIILEFGNIIDKIGNNLDGTIFSSNIYINKLDGQNKKDFYITRYGDQCTLTFQSKYIYFIPDLTNKIALVYDPNTSTGVSATVYVNGKIKEWYYSTSSFNKNININKLGFGDINNQGKDLESVKVNKMIVYNKALTEEQVQIAINSVAR